MLDQGHEDEASARQALPPPGFPLIRALGPAIWKCFAQLWSWRWSVLAMAAALAVAGQYGPTAIFGPLVATDPVVRGEFVRSVVASGHVEAPYRVNVGSQITGVVAGVPVEEGQSVKAGDTLIQLDDREARAAVVQAEGAAAQSEARMRQMREFTLPTAQETLRQAQATFLNTQQSLDRIGALAKSGVATKAALDDAVRARDVARTQVHSAELQVYTVTPGGSDYVMAETQLNQAKANLASAQSRLSYTVIKAPRDGILIKRSVEQGNVVQPAMVLMTLSPFVDAQIVVDVDEKNLGQLALGQRAIVSADAFPREAFAADVIYINPGIDLQKATVEIKLRVPDPPAFIRQDMTVSVDIETARHPNSLIAPIADIRDAGGGAPWVLVAANGRAVRRSVQLGLVGDGRVEIVTGLDAGDRLLPPGSSVKPGGKMRIAPVAPRTS